MQVHPQAESQKLRLVFVGIHHTQGQCPDLLDAVYKDREGAFRGQMSNETGQQLQQRYSQHYSAVKMMRMSDYDKLHDAALRTEPEEITEEEFFEALNVLPPMKWHCLLGVESFRMCEFYSGTITTIYARTDDGRYWKFMDDAYMPTADVVAKVHKAATAAKVSA